MQRIIAVVFFVLVLLGLVIYSQFRPLRNTISGIIEADEIRVGSRVGGRVANVVVQEGQRVEAGQTLLQLAPFDLLEREQEAAETLAAREADYQRLQNGFREEEKLQAKSRYDQLQAKFEMLKAGPRPQEIAAAKARLDLSAAELRLAQRNHDRARTLIENNAISREELDRFTEELESAYARSIVSKEELALLEAGTREEELDQAEAEMEAARQAWLLTQKGYRLEEIEQARAARDAARAGLEALRQRKEELTITSPVRGVVEALELQRGDLVAAGAPVLSIMDDSDLWVRAYLPEDRLDIRVGDRLLISVDSYPSQRFAGEVTFVSRQAEFTPSNVQTPEERSKQVFRVKVKLLEALDKLRPGMAADVWLEEPPLPPP